MIRKFYRGTISLEETRDYIEGLKSRRIPYNPNIAFSCYDGERIDIVCEIKMGDPKKVEA